MLKFNYTKNDGSESLRKLVVLSRPTELYFGIDVTNANEKTIEELEAVVQRHKYELEEVIYGLELEKKYRSFKALNMSKTSDL